MARQHVHNRRAGHGNGGASWISYSDIMAALVLMFILFLIFTLYNFNRNLQTKSDELAAKEQNLIALQGELDTARSILIVQTEELETAKAETEQLKISIALQQAELDAQNIILIGKMNELDDAKATLAQKETELAKKEKELQALRLQLKDRVGIRSKIIEDLSRTLRRNKINVAPDQNGDITLGGAVLFSSNSYEITGAGQSFLKTFVPIYLNVLLKPEYQAYIGEIIIEGHTDSSGTYVNNLKLSQNRALAVAIYCLEIVKDNAEQTEMLKRILTAKGRSFSDLIRVNGVEDSAASRRVEFKFSLRDEEMIDDLNNMLGGQDGQ